MRQDPYRVHKEEFLHQLHERHKHGGKVGQLDVSDISAAKMILTGAMHKQGVVLSVGETADMIGDMARAIGGETLLAGQQVASQKDYEMRCRRVAGMQKRNEQKARQLLTQKNRRR